MMNPAERAAWEEEKRLMAESKKELAEFRKQIMTEHQLLVADQTKWKQTYESQRAGMEKGYAMLQTEQAKIMAEKARASVSAVGSIKEFDVQSDWAQWCERVKLYFAANEIPEDKQLSLFLTLIGSEAYALLRNLCTPVLPSDRAMEDLITELGTHLQPTPSVITERFKFKECRQKEGESVRSYLVNLKQLSLHCDFGINLNSCIRDQFVWGVSDNVLKKKLLAEKDLTYTRAGEIAFSFEAASKDVEAMGMSAGDSVNFVASTKKRAPKSNAAGSTSISCYCCGLKGHKSNDCRLRNVKCFKCDRVGHVAVVCKAKRQPEKQRGEPSSTNNNKSETTHNFVEDVDGHDNFDNIFHLGELSDVIASIEGEEPVFAEMLIQETSIRFIVDSGSPITAVSERLYRSLDAVNSLELKETSRKFRSHPGQQIIPLGFLNVNVRFEAKSAKLELFVLPGNGPPIVGRKWIRALKIPVMEEETSSDEAIRSIVSTDSGNSSKFFEAFADVFSEKLGHYKKARFELHLKQDAKPIFCNPRPVPYALREKVEREIDRLLSDDVLMPVENSEWATPIVPVLKKNGQIRLCGDYKVTLNPQLKVDRYPIPRVQDLLARLSCGKFFSKLDLSHAYQQVELTDSSRSLVTISTHKGLFAYKRLCFGVASAPGLFQREMDKILSGLEGVLCFFDDVLIGGSSREEHDKRLVRVLLKFRECGLTVRKDKCVIASKSVKFLGFELSDNGLSVSNDRVKAVVDVKIPSNETELRAFLGMINYYAKFIKNFAKIVSPLYELLRKNEKWVWSRQRNEAFQLAKRALISHDVLMHYDSQLPIKIACDASPRGLGAVLSHVLPNKVERPIAFASRSLTKAETGYSQLDREALGIVFGVKTFHQYVFGRKFTLETDHKPLTFIFGSKKGLPQMAASRVQRWAVFLAGYDMEIEHIKGVDNGHADSLSRIITSTESGEASLLSEFSYLNFVKEGVKSLDSDEVAEKTLRDPVLREIVNFTMRGWPSVIVSQWQPFKERERELTVEQGCLLWGHRLVIPTVLRQELLDELHAVHMGTVRMKALARSYIWWPSIDKDIEGIVKRCELCLKSADFPPRAELHVWEWPQGPNFRLHADFLGPVDGKMFLIIIDAFSKWVEVKEMRDITSETTIRAFKEYFCTWGMPRKLVTDNGPSFCSREFEDFLERNGIRHVKTAPYHPASNGAAENAVRTFKNKFKILLQEGNSRHEAVCRFLLHYRSTPHCTIGCSPAELQVGWKLRTRLEQVRPNIRDFVESKQHSQQRFFRGNRKLELAEREVVMAKDFVKNSWLKAQVENKLSPVSYSVRTADDRVWKRHIDQLKQCDLSFKRAENCQPESSVSPKAASDKIPSVEGENVAISEPVKEGAFSGPVTSGKRLSVLATNTPTIKAVKSSPVLRRSERAIKPRVLLDL